MKNQTINLLKLTTVILGATCLFISCGQSREERNNTEESAANQSKNSINKTESTPIKSSFSDSTRSFVRKADLFFKVKDVKQSTFDIEKIVNEHNGYVTKSDLESQTNYKTSTRISKDSMQDVINYTVKSNVLIRVPNNELDATLSQIDELVDYLEYRKINLDDVTKQFMNAKFADKRFKTHKDRLEKVIDNKGQKLNQLVDAENNLESKQEAADDIKVNTMELIHDVKYSTVSIAMYQKETTKTVTYAIALPIEPFKPGFGFKFVNAITDGAYIFGEIVVFFIRLWPIVLLILGIIYLIKFIRKKKLTFKN